MPELCKLTIKAYSDNTFGTEKGVFNSLVNPTNLTISNDIKYSPSSIMGSDAVSLRYQTATPEELSFSLVFDNTGIVVVDKPLPIDKQISDLQKVISDFQQDISEPLYVRVIWGIIDFKGKLTKLDILYSHFSLDGTPVRAEVDICVLKQDIPATGNIVNNSADGKTESQPAQTSNDTADGKTEAQPAKTSNDTTAQDATAKTVPSTMQKPTAGMSLSGKIGELDFLRGGRGVLGGLLGGVLGTVLGTLLGVLGGALIGAVLKGILEVLGKLLGGLWNLLKKLFSKLWEWIKKGIAFIKSKF